jgi:hypothetical protein
MIRAGLRFLAAIVVLTITSFGAAAQQVDDPELVAAAKKEGQLAFYTRSWVRPFISPRSKVLRRNTASRLSCST